jgi:hypothetical protein
VWTLCDISHFEILCEPCVISLISIYVLCLYTSCCCWISIEIWHKLLLFFIVFEHFFEVQACFATLSGDAALLRHSQWRRSLCLLRCGWRSCLLCFATPSGDASCFATPSGDALLPRHSQWRRKPGYMNSAQIHISYIIYHISKIIYQRSKIIYQRSKIIYQRSYIKYQRLYIIYQISKIIYQASSSQYHIQFHISSIKLTIWYACSGSEVNSECWSQ